MADPLLRFHGAAGSVTGSCFLLEHAGTRTLIDCGMFQGSKTEKELNYRPFPFEASSIHSVILTHAHIDHSGLLPKLVKAGFQGPIYCTAATSDLCTIMLQDSGHIQEMEVEQLNRRNKSRFRQMIEPIYTVADAQAAMTQFRSIGYKEWQETEGALRFRFWDAGHLLGSASVELELVSSDGTIRMLFSGDIGPQHKLFEAVPEAPEDFDYLICESTYGDRERDDASPEARRRQLRQIVSQAYHPNGALLIPSFAVERTQELLADLNTLMDANELQRIPIIIDSPLASRATSVFKRHARSLSNSDLLLRALNAKNVRFTETAEQSKAIDLIHGFHIIIAASGMCEAGRIRHRLKNWLWHDEATILLVGFQAAGTLGRILQDGAHAVKIQGEQIAVRATIQSLDAYSGHADATELENWILARLPIRKGLFLVHGEPAAIGQLSSRISGHRGVPIVLEPELDSAYHLTKDGAVASVATTSPPRLRAEEVGHFDWHNDYQSLVLDLDEELRQAADEKRRAIILRRVRKALQHATD
ncbi:MBL fold metallo-hydrolase [Rhizobium sp. P40RR-XXII]|uniref:MBL fold metallo-hydrolase n=1 Tax=Rhizobium sp. P40RR-XXII TaxID=2726739 RepID=UPI001456E14B|nr:MBL fold metallo-hydrolase [Rhizobium sp. P40RR-XXII]NLS20367.1 MBL fold metallo-hydrolase [Rhizobium sp. P40RR-XXII]